MLENISLIILKARFAQTRLTEGALVAGRNIANSQSIKAALSGYYVDLSVTEYVLTQAGDDKFKYFKQNLVVTLNLSLGKVNVTMITPIVTQLREIDATMQIAFSTNS